MMESRTTSRATFSQRCRILSVAAHVVRERAIRDGDSFEGWCLSRLMREISPSKNTTIGDKSISCARPFPLRSREPSRHAAVEAAVMELGNQQSRIKAARCYARAAFSFERSGLRSRACH